MLRSQWYFEDVNIKRKSFTHGKSASFSDNIWLIGGWGFRHYRHQVKVFWSKYCSKDLQSVSYIHYYIIGLTTVYGLCTYVYGQISISLAEESRFILFKMCWNILQIYYLLLFNHCMGIMGQNSNDSAFVTDLTTHCWSADWVLASFLCKRAQNQVKYRFLNRWGAAVRSICTYRTSLSKVQGDSVMAYLRTDEKDTEQKVCTETSVILYCIATYYELSY